jgi:hypothetical protein
MLKLGAEVESIRTRPKSSICKINLGSHDGPSKISELYIFGGKMEKIEIWEILGILLFMRSS